MKTASKTAKTVNTSKNKPLTKAQIKAKRESSDYYQEVILPLRDLKTESKSFIGAFKMLLLITPLQDARGKDIQRNIDLVNKLKGLNKQQYGKLKKACRKSKAGNYCPFYVAQALKKLDI